MTRRHQQKPEADSQLSVRLRRELATVTAMIRIYCRSHHAENSTLCYHCSKLTDYVFDRLRHCIFAGDKPTCANCPVHCYKPSMRTEIIRVMRYSGPRMVVHHPYLALMHVLDGRRVVKKLSCTDCKKPTDNGESRQ